MWGSTEDGPALMRATRRLGVPLMALLLGALGTTNAHAASLHKLEIKVIYATRSGSHVDPKLHEMAQQLRTLKFKSFTLKDHAEFKLELGSSGRMQLPGGEWMTVKALDVVKGGLLRTEIAVAKLNFKATVQIGPKGTVVTRGPPFEDGTLILAVTRPKD